MAHLLRLGSANTKRHSIVKRRSIVKRYSIVAICWGTLWLSGCALWVEKAPEYLLPEAQSCAHIYHTLDRYIIDAGVRDAAYHRLPGYPYYRSTRFLASFIPELKSAQWSRRRDWLRRMNRLAVEGLMVEVVQLERLALERLFDEMHMDGVFDQSTDLQHFETQLRQCGDTLVRELDRRPLIWGDLLRKARVPDHYQTWKRWLGLYPLIALPFKRAVEREHKSIATQELDFYRHRFKQGTQQLYRPQRRLSIGDGVALIKSSTQDTLGVPLLAEQDREQLLNAWAPAWVIDSTADNDRVGRIGWSKEGEIALDAVNPGFYGFVTFGRFDNEITLQLNYSVWFSGRKKQGKVDLLAGQLDGLIWRVHLRLSGELIAADSIHNCGCWYQLYPAPGYRVKSSEQLYSEPTYISSQGQRQQPARLFLQTNTHFLLGVEEDGVTVHANIVGRDGLVDPSATGARVDHIAATPIVQLKYRGLRALAMAGGGRRSLFTESGLVEASKRGERWLLWPMGIASPGAMRIMGTHAIAFIGRRHFDAPALLNDIGIEKHTQDKKEI